MSDLYLPVNLISSRNTSGKSCQGWTWLHMPDHTQLIKVALKGFFSLVTISMTKIWRYWLVPSDTDIDLSYWWLKAHWRISKTRYSEKHRSSDEACQFSVLQGTPGRSYLEKTDNWRLIYKQTNLTFYTSNDVSKRC